MITLSIKNPTVKKLWSWIAPGNNTRPSTAHQHAPFRSPQLMALAAPNSNRMGKIEYAKWIENQKLKFKVGEMVTLAIITPQANICPWLLRVTYIEEDHNQVRWDTTAHEPAAITVVTSTGVYNHKAPSTLRKLTIEEAALADLSNTQPLGTA